MSDPRIQRLQSLQHAILASNLSAAVAKVSWLWHGLAASAVATAAVAAITAIDINQRPLDLYLLKSLGYTSGYGLLHNVALHAAGASGDFNTTYPLLIIPAFVALAWGLHTHSCARLVYVCLPVSWFPLRYGHVEELAMTGLALAAAAAPTRRAWVHIVALALKPTAAAYAGSSLRRSPLLVSAALSGAAVHTILSLNRLPRGGQRNGEELWSLPFTDTATATAMRVVWIAAALIIGARWHSSVHERLIALAAIASLRAASEITVFAYYLTPAAIIGLVLVHLSLRGAKTPILSPPETSSWADRRPRPPNLP